MAFRSAQSARVLMGILSASAYTRNLGGSYDNEMLDVTTLVDTARKFIVGQNTSTFTIDGPLDTDPTANAQFDVLNDQLAGLVNVPVSFGFDGFTLANTGIWLINALDSQLTYSSTNAGTTDWSLSAQVDGITDFNGVSLSDIAAVTIDTNGTTVDGGAATANGGVGHLHVTAFSGLTSNSVIVEHSTNDSVWSTLGTFTLVSGVTSERLVIAAGTTVNRYLRVRDDVTGTGSCTRAAFFARR